MRLFTFSSLLLCLFLIPTAKATAQVLVYRTADDFVNENPMVYKNHEFVSQSGKYNNVVVNFRDRQTKDKVALECANIWGFAYKNKLFRVLKANRYYDRSYVNFPVLLSTTSVGGPLHWVSGNALVAEVHKERENIVLNPIYTSYVSANYTSDLILAPIDDLSDAYTKRLMVATRQFVEDNPQLEWFHDCMKQQTEAAGERKKDVLRYHLVGRCMNERNKQEQ